MRSTNKARFVPENSGPWHSSANRVRASAALKPSNSSCSGLGRAPAAPGSLTRDGAGPLRWVCSTSNANWVDSRSSSPMSSWLDGSSHCWSSTTRHRGACLVSVCSHSSRACRVCCRIFSGGLKAAASVAADGCSSRWARPSTRAGALGRHCKPSASLLRVSCGPSACLSPKRRASNSSTGWNALSVHSGSHRSSSTCAPASCSRRMNSCTKRVLPMPASPEMSTVARVPPQARAQAPSSWASSRWRPTQGPPCRRSESVSTWGCSLTKV